jgi:RNA polymerase sigma-70 factor (ECF subfamily)
MSQDERLMILSKVFDAVVIEKTPAAEALDRNLVTQSDLLRLKVLARLHARGLPPQVGWADLLQEAFARVLDGSRRQPEGLPIVPFVAGIMRSIKAGHWRRARREARQLPKLQATDPVPNPERELIALQELALINKLFAADSQALALIAGLADGCSPEEICAANSMSKTDYDSTRRRIRRILLREGLRSPQP